MRAARGSALALLACLAATGGAARAGTVSVSPTQLRIARSGVGVDVTVANGSASAGRYSVRGFRWRQTAEGSPELAPTDDLVVFPQSFTLGAFERRIVRVGFPGAVTSAEQAFRIVITELGGDDANGPLTLAVRNRITLPLFVALPGGRPAPAAREAAVTRTALSATIVEQGSVHDVLTNVRLRADDGSGSALVTRTLPGWYLLPGQARVFTVPLDAGLCTRVRTVTVDATFESGVSLRATLEPSHAC